MIYFDHAATTKTSPEVSNAIMDVLENHWGNPSNIYSIGIESKRIIEQARSDIANELNCEPDEIYFTSGGSEANSWALAQGTKIFATNIEHDSILNNPLVDKLNVDDCGTVKIGEIEAIFEERDPSLLSTMWVNNEIGSVNDIVSIGELCDYYGILYHVDAVQALGNIEIDLQKLPVDMMSFSGHKINAPKGIGFLYISNETRRNYFDKKVVPFKNPFSSIIYGGKQEQGIRGGTENITGIVGFAEAIKGINSKVEIKTQKYTRLTQIITQILGNNSIDYINNSKGIPALTSLSFRGIDGEALMFLLDLEGICVSTGSACTSGSVGASHVLKAISCPEEYIGGTIRISYGLENTEEEATILANSIVKNVNKLKNMNNIGGN